MPFASGTEAAWTTIGPGESAVFLEAAVPATDVPAFRSFWNIGPNAGTVRNPKVATYVGSGVSFSSGGDGVIVFRSDATEVTRTAFGAATGGSTFFWSYDSAGVAATPTLRRVLPSAKT